MAVVTSPRRAAPRAQVTLDVVLSRPTGSPVRARTVDVSAGGARVSTNRPLRVDEVLAFELTLDEGEPVAGQARVLREQATTYALRFERVRGEGAQRVADVVDAALARPPD